jgi:hypothetical protein
MIQSAPGGRTKGLTFMNLSGSFLYPSLLLLSLLLSSTTASTNDTAAIDERTLLDVFGEAAKEFLTQKVFPSTSQDCHWNWRHARCEPYCSCKLQFQWGDYHLGRSCRTFDRPVDCDIPSDTIYAMVLNATITKSQLFGNLVKARAQLTLQKTGERMTEMQLQVCDGIPDANNCFSGDRNWREKIMCGYIPSCEDEVEEPTEIDFDTSNIMTGFKKGKWSWN